MGNKVIIVYKQQDGRVAVVHPTPEAYEMHDIHTIASKTVPAGAKYKLMFDSELPQDRTFRNAWDIDESELTDGIGALSNEFEETQ